MPLGQNESTVSKVSSHSLSVFPNTIMDPSQLEENNGTTFSHQLQETGSYVGLLWPRGCCCSCCLLAKSCLTLCDPVDCSPPGTSVHEMLQARVLEWIAISCSRGSSRLRDPTHVSCLAGRCFTTELPGKPHDPGKRYSKHLCLFELTLKLDTPFPVISQV